MNGNRNRRRVLPPALRSFARAVAPLLLTLALATSLVALGGCRLVAGIFGGTSQVEDDAGREVVVPRRAARIVSLAPSNTEIVFAVGAGAKLVGVDEYSDYPAEAAAIAKVGAFADVNVEALVALKPDVVLASTMHGKLLPQLEGLGLKVLVVEPKTFADLYDDILLVGRIAGTEQKAIEVVAAMRAKLEAVSTRLSGLKPEDRPLVYYEVYSDPLMSAGPLTYIHQVIELAGGRNLTAGAQMDYPIVSAETVVAGNPAVIVYPVFPGGEALTPQKVAARPGWAAIAAVRNGRVVGIDADIISRGGPRLADAVVELARLLHPALVP